MSNLYIPSIFRFAGPQETVLCVGQCVGAWSIFETRRRKLWAYFRGIHSRRILLVESLYPEFGRVADL